MTKKNPYRTPKFRMETTKEDMLKLAKNKFKLDLSQTLSKARIARAIAEAYERWLYGG